MSGLRVKLSRTSKAKKKQVCRTVRDKRTKRKKKVCTPVKKQPLRKPGAKPAPVPKAQPGLPVPSPGAAPVAAGLQPAAAPAPAPEPVLPGPAPTTPPPSTPAPPPPPPPDLGPIAPPTPVHGTLTRADAERLLWRAGFGPRPGQAAALAGKQAKDVVATLTRPVGAPVLTGDAPRDSDGNRIDPNNVWGHEHVWWLDRMVRSDQQLVEKLTLVFHDWFATSNADVDNRRLMLAQNETLRRHALGSFAEMTRDITRDPAMLVFLNGNQNRKGAPNENYARELMELFTLGADRGAYTETDVRELARALTGWRSDWVDGTGHTNFRFDANRFDAGTKTLWAGTAHQRSGAFGWQDAVRLCLEHPLHASFFVRKLWSAFIPTAPSQDTQAKLEQLYVGSGYAIRPVVEAILLHPDLYAGPPLAKSPVVYTAGLLRALNRTIETTTWAWRCSNAGQLLFHPPSVAGWNDQAWLDTATIRGRWDLGWEILAGEYIDPWNAGWSATETPEEAVAKALQFWGEPTISEGTKAELLRFAAESAPSSLLSWQRGPFRAQRQNALRHLIIASPDFQIA